MKQTALCLMFLLISGSAYATNFGNDANCMGYWAMEADGNEPDLSGEGGTVNETSGDIPQDADEAFGTYARDFEYSDSEYLTHADGGSTDISGSNQDLSIVCWIQPESTGYTVYPVAKADDGGDWQYAIYQYSGDSVGFYMYNGAEMDTYSDSDVTEGVWTHVAGVYNDTDGRVYFDGSQNGDPDNFTNGIDNTNEPFMIGAVADGGGATDYFDGLIDDVAVFNRELTALEVSDIEEFGVAGPAVSARRIISITNY